MDLTVTTILISASAALMGFAIWQSSRPKKDLMRARLVSWRFVAILAFVPLLYGAVHLVNLMGLTTGR